MAKTKYFAVDANGKTHTRTSARTYTHMVVVLANLEAGREAARSEHNRKAYARNHAFYCQEAGPAPKYSSSPAEMARYKAAAAMTCEEYVNNCVANALAAIDARGGEFANDWADFGWCGRLDLAQKLAAKWAHMGKVEILEAQQA
ncbi:hypothetical protein MQ4_53 [Serratia phage MQ-4]|nr:hypothetical protein MQ4_53 [Serratia phage MQ-4]